jgi:hypothetical protein
MILGKILGVSTFFVNVSGHVIRVGSWVLEDPLNRQLSILFNRTTDFEQKHYLRICLELEKTALVVRRVA